MLGNHTLEIS